MNTTKILPHQDVVVENGLIKTIKPTARNKYANATVIDASGKYLMPGLADMHVHLPRKDQFGYGLDQFFQLHLAAGITTLRSMRGDEADPELQRLIGEGKKLAPDLYISAPPFSARYWLSSDSLTRLVRQYKSSGFQLLKVLSIPSVTWYDTLTQIARKENIRLAGHAPAGVLFAKALGQGIGCIEHLGGYETLPIDKPDFDEAVQRTLANKVYNCPTLDWYFVNYTQITLDSLKRRRGLDRLPTALLQSWNQTMENYLSQQARKHPDSLRKEQVAENQYVLHKLEVLKRLYPESH
ncbi:amidohydrolase family protein [Spirosoma montaniterrae]|nr:hypothetical protein [Spirosoma montaniterrae]